MFQAERTFAVNPKALGQDGQSLRKRLEDVE